MNNNLPENNEINENSKEYIKLPRRKKYIKTKSVDYKDKIIQKDCYILKRKRCLSINKGNNILTNTLDDPIPSLIIRAISIKIYKLIEDNLNEGNKIDPTSELFFFSEEKILLEFPNRFLQDQINFIRQYPYLEDIIEFIEVLYNTIQFSPECLLISFIYIKKFIDKTKMYILPLTWRPLIVVTLFIAQKLWDDSSINNQTMVETHPFFLINEFNTLENMFLRLIEFKIFLNFGEYAKLFLELKELVPADDMDLFMNQEELNYAKIKDKIREDFNNAKLIYDNENNGI